MNTLDTKPTPKPRRDTRHVSLARSLHARLYVNCEGRIFVVRGKFERSRLATVLARYDRPPTVAEAPTPREFGIDACDGELAADLLERIRLALHRWEKELESEARRKPARRRKTDRLIEERGEIRRLWARWTLLRRWQGELADGREPVGAPLFLDAVAEAGLRTAIDEAECEQPLGLFIAWQARVIAWLAGDFAVRRYLAAVTGLMRAYPEISRYEQIRSLQVAAMSWKRRSTGEPAANLRLEITEHLRRIPSDVLSEGQIPTRLHHRTLTEACDRIIAAGRDMLAKSDGLRTEIPCALAALAAADRSAVPLPRRTFEAGASEEDFARLKETIAALSREIGLPGYDALLKALDGLPASLDPSHYEGLRTLLAKGNAPAEVAWAHEHDLLYGLTDSCLNVTAARRLAESFDGCGTPLGDDRLFRLICRIQKPADLRFVNRWTIWLGSVSPRVLSPRLRRVVEKTFWEVYLPGVARCGGFEQLESCIGPAKRGRGHDDLSPLMERIGALERLLGRPDRPPKSLRKLLENDERRHRECEYLRARAAAGELDDAARPRLHKLETGAVFGAGGRAGVKGHPIAKLRRTAERAFLRLGVEALRTVTRRWAEIRCREHLEDLMPRLPPDRLEAFADWIEKMTPAERDRLRTVIASRRRHGSKYKRHLAENRAWISRAAAHGLNLDAWFSAEPEQLSIGGRSMKIGVAGDLPEIFLMGTYFGTCLSVGNLNEMSILTNAYDANKQVVFIFAADDAGRRRAVARQLIAVSRDFKLLGYCSYVNEPRTGESNRPEVVEAMARYVGRLAARCGLEMADEGEPEPIGDHFWYDDGAHEWPEAARAARAGHEPAAELLATC